MKNKPTNVRPSVDHSLLSPSGKMSKATRTAAMKRETAKLFPSGYWDKPELTNKEKVTQKVQSLCIAAKTLRDLADRGMNRRKYIQEAIKLEEQADSLRLIKPDQLGTDEVWSKG